MADRSFMGRGPIYIKVKGASGGMQAIGNCSQLEVSFEDEEVTQPDFTRAGGGSANKVTRVGDATGNMTMLDFSSANLALALRGTSVAVPASAVTDEAHSTIGGSDDEFIPFDEMPDVTQPITVRKTDATALVEGTDYTRENGGIKIIGSGGIDNTGILVNYTVAAYENLEALTNSGLEYELLFNGLNEAQGGKLVTVRLWRVKFNPATGVGFISDEFGNLEVPFTALNDPAITATDESQVMRVRQVL
ncbi:MAG: hypothetical protein AAFY29_22735 [Pseudomonadota bacterium]